MRCSYLLSWVAMVFSIYSLAGVSKAEAKRKCHRVKITCYAPGKTCRHGGVQGGDRTAYLNRRIRPSRMAADRHDVVAVAIPQTSRRFLGHFAETDIRGLNGKTLAIVDVYGRSSDHYGDDSTFRKMDVSHSSCAAMERCRYNQRYATVCLSSGKMSRYTMTRKIQNRLR